MASSSDRWKIKIVKKGSLVITKTLRNQTGGQLRKLKNEWASNKRTPESEYFNTEFHFEAEPNVKGMK